MNKSTRMKLSQFEDQIIDLIREQTETQSINNSDLQGSVQAIVLNIFNQFNQGKEMKISDIVIYPECKKGHFQYSPDHLFQPCPTLGQ